jgi:hypothetical protein
MLNALSSSPSHSKERKEGGKERKDLVPRGLLFLYWSLVASALVVSSKSSVALGLYKVLHSWAMVPCLGLDLVFGSAKALSLLPGKKWY